MIRVSAGLARQHSNSPFDMQKTTYEEATFFGLNSNITQGIFTLYQ